MGKFKLYLGDCLEIMPRLAGKVDVIITDPPYPDYNGRGREWAYVPIDEWSQQFNCRQLIFWPADREFPLSFTSRHVWHKPNGQTNVHYEFIYERYGHKVHRVYRVPIINYRTLPEWTPHPTQKPLRLMRLLIERSTNPGQVIFDPFMGSGSTGVAALQLGHGFIGIEKNPNYFAIAKKRIEEASRQLLLPEVGRITTARSGAATPQASQAQLFDLDEQEAVTSNNASR